MASEADEEEVEEASLGRTSSKCGASSGSEDIPRVFSPISKVCTEIPIPTVKEICGSDLPEIGVSLKMQSNVIPSSGALSIISPSVAVPLLEQPSVLGTDIVDGLGTSAHAPVREPNTLAANVIGSPVVFPALSIKAVLAFPDDLAVLARKCIGTAMAVLDVAYIREGSRFQVCKEGLVKEIYEKLVETLGTRGIHLSPVEDETL
ncbi:hypothetical protein CJ030_MR6G005335 [Morella rubra]|uniref:Uncharacterized protein n=1 Tax=Morella rubra TaxID=262757 RepID=A0A6A1VF98_9ROSI|nr:hypothetical protein CJ030_MR6G005335 [Morella rubra]